ncbi:MAG: L-aspartate semialdehyde sulfurtransferase ferredoxin [Verrucomicrobiota bacterium]|jgi:ABC-type methionine transport system ATPase subunit
MSNKARKPAAKSLVTPAKTRVWLTYPPQKIKRPIIWELGKKFDIITDIRQASVNDELGIVCLELDGPRAEIKAAIAWLEKSGVTVDPVEINVIES